MKKLPRLTDKSLDYLATTWRKLPTGRVLTVARSGMTLVGPRAAGWQTWLNTRRRLATRTTAVGLAVFLLLLNFIHLLTTLPPTLSLLEQGRQAYNTGSYTMASTLLRQELTTNPADSSARLLLAQSAIALHQWTAAGGYLADLVRESPNDPVIYYWIGRAQLGAGQLAEAQASWNLILNRTDPAAMAVRPQISLALGRLRFDEGQYAEASRLLFEALNSQASFEALDHQEAFYLYGLLLARDLRFDDAFSPLQRALNFDPGSEAGNLPSQAALDRTSERARQVLQLLPAAANEPVEGAKRARLAYAFLVAEEYTAAEEQLLQVLRATPTYTDARAYLGIVYWRTGRSERAINTLNAALAEQPSNRLARQALAEILIDRLPALQLKSEDAAQFRQEGDRAKQLLESLQTEKPNDPTLQVTYARYFVASHDYQSAQVHYQKALDLNRANPVTGLNAEAVLSRYYSDTNFDPCVRGVDTGLAATRDYSGDADSWYAAGLAYGKCGHPDLAAPMLEKAVTLRPYWPDALYRLGLAYDALQRKPEADRLFTLLADLDPDRVYPRRAQ